jgi:hypothetical protein
LTIWEWVINLNPDFGAAGSQNTNGFGVAIEISPTQDVTLILIQNRQSEVTVDVLQGEVKVNSSVENIVTVASGNRSHNSGLIVILLGIAPILSLIVRAMAKTWHGDNRLIRWLECGVMSNVDMRLIHERVLIITIWIRPVYTLAK